MEAYKKNKSPLDRSSNKYLLDRTKSPYNQNSYMETAFNEISKNESSFLMHKISPIRSLTYKEDSNILITGTNQVKINNKSLDKSIGKEEAGFQRLKSKHIMNELKLRINQLLKV